MSIGSEAGDNRFPCRASTLSRDGEDPGLCLLDITGHHYFELLD